MSSCQNTGRLACPCATSYLGFRVANADSIGRLNVSVADSVCASGCDYGMEYGLNLCVAHDSGMPPFCNVPGAPAWCSSPWCYVNASHCALDHAESSYLEGEGGLHYSYATCSAPDSFTDWYLARTGTLQLCSVFAEADGGGPCGTARTHLQIEAMVGAINELNGGAGFSLRSGLITRTYRFNYTYHTYPAGSWATHGRNLSRATFGSDRCDVVVGMTSGCPDDEIAAQALVANETRRIYVTGRDPRVLTAGGAEQPYLFSTYVDSNHYARAALERYQKLGASSSALLYEDNGDPFYAGLGRQAIEDARALAYDVRYNASLRRRADGAVDYAALTAHLTAAHGTAPDVLVLTVPEPLFSFALERLKSWRPPDAPNAHVYSGVWWSGVASGNETCAGLAEECEHVTGAAQMASDEALRGYTDALLEDTAYATYEQLRAARMPASSSGGGGDGGQLVEQPDAAAIASLLAQALIKLFRFRDMPKPDKPLSDPLDYELLRSYLRSGERIAITYIGPISFDARGQNVGRPPTLLQVSGGHAQPVLSQSAAQSAVSSAQLDYPAPAAECPADSHRLDYDGSCLLCSASTCEESAPPAIWLISIATGVGGAGLLLVLVGFCFLRRRLRRQAVRFGLSPYRLAKLVGWRYLLPAVFQRWWLRRHHLDAHTQLRKAAKEAERPDEQFRAELRGDAELRALFDRVASPATGLVGMQDWLRFCSADQAEADLEKARTQFLLAVREAHLTAMAAESSRKSHTGMATPPAPRRVIEAARAAAGMARDGVGKASELSKRRSGSTLPAVSGGVCGPGGGGEGATLNHEQFALLLLRSENRATCPRLLGEEHDASRPLSHYWIAASHNTYITGHQLTSEADAGMYSRLLLCGCRSLEVDIVDGMDGPVVTHHYTLVTRIQLKKVLHAIADAAFITSDLPVHLSLDVRASPKQQARAAELIVEVLGSALVLPEERLADGAPLAAACPHLLRRRILCKGKTVAGRELAARICGDCRRSEDRFTVSSAQESRRTVSTLTTTLRESDNEDGWALPRASEERDSRTSFPSGSTARVSFPSGILGESSADPTQSFRPSTLSSGSGRLGSETSTAAALGRIVIRTHAMALQRVEAAHALAREAFFLERPREGRDSGELLTVTSASELHFSHAAEAKLSDALGVIMPPPGRKQSTSHRSRSSISPGRLFGRKAPRSTTSGSLDLPSSDGSQRLAKAKRLSEEEWRVAMQERTVRRVVRVFPKGTRTKSDNFDPMPCWAAGAQMAALNLQTNDLPSQLHHALFELNGGRGYVLKPAEMLGEPGGGVAPNWPPPRVVLHVATLRPISLFGLPPRGIDRPDVFGGGGSLHTYVPSLSVAVGKRRMRAPRGEDELPSLAVELHAIGGFSCVSLTLPPATARTRQLVSAKGGGGGEAVRYGGEVHCVAAERQQTVLRVAVLDEEEEAAYETCVLGVLREGYRVLHMRSTRGTRIRNCFLLCHISFTTQVNAWVGESEMMAYVRSKEKEMEEKVDEAAAEVAKLKTGKVVSHLKAMVGSHGAFESATRGGEQLEQLAAANKETSGWTEESVEQSV